MRGANDAELCAQNAKGTSGRLRIFRFYFLETFFLRARKKSKIFPSFFSCQEKSAKFKRVPRAHA